MTVTRDEVHESCEVRSLNTLLVRELAAVETYDHTIRCFESMPVSADLDAIREDHARAAEELRGRVERLGGEPAAASEAWNTFACPDTDTARDFGVAMALTTLKQGEEHGIWGYEAALKEEGIDPACKDVIRSELLPNCRHHITELDRLLAGA